MFKKIVILFVSVLVFSCKAGLPGSLFTSDLGEPENTVLSDYFSLCSIAPPSIINFKYKEIDNNQIEIHLFWNAVSYSEGYRLYESSILEEGYQFLSEYETSEAVIVKTQTTADQAYFYKIASMNSGEESILSAPINVMMSASTYNLLSVPMVSASCGTEKTIVVKWAPIEGCYQYQIRRAISGQNYSDSTIVNESFIPSVVNSSLYAWSDFSAIKGVYYDYWVLPLTDLGDVGPVGACANRAFVYPVPQNFNVSQGHSLRSVGDGYSVIELSWEYPLFLTDSTGRPVDDPATSGIDEGVVAVPVIDKWNIEAGYGSSGFKSIEKIYDMSGDVPDELTVLKKIDAAASWIGLGLDDFTSDAEISGLYTKEDVESNRVYYVYRMTVVNKNIGPEFTETYLKLYTFQVSAIFDEYLPTEYLTPVSGVYKGYAVDPAAMTLPVLNLTIETGSVLSDPDSIPDSGDEVLLYYADLSWTDDVSVAAYYIYKNLDGDISSQLVAKIVSPISEYRDTATEPFSASYSISVCDVVANDLLQSEQTMSVPTTIGGE